MLNSVHPYTKLSIYDSPIHHSSILFFLTYVGYGNWSANKSEENKKQKNIKLSTDINVNSYSYIFLNDRD